jgi:hypothetical protein
VTHEQDVAVIPDPEEERSLGYWNNTRRLLLAAAWLSVIGMGTFMLAIGAAVSGGGLFGEVSTREDRLDTVPYWFLDGLLASAGPLGIWLFRRRWTWLVLGFVCIAAGAAQAALIYWSD